jgi:subtilase family serine protease
MRKSTTLPALVAACALATGALTTAGAGAASARAQIARSRPTWATAANRVHDVSNDGIVVRVYLRSRNAAGLEATARAVSNPQSSQYRHFLSPADVRARFAPAPATVDAVRSFLAGNGFRLLGQPANRAYVEAIGSPRSVEAAFAVQLGVYKVRGKELRAADRNLSVPAGLASSVTGVIGVDEAQQLLQPNNTTGQAAPHNPAPAGFRNASPCSAFWAEKLDTTDPAYGGGFPSPLPYAPCGYKPGQLRSAYGVASTVDGGRTGASATVAVIDAFASPTIYQDASEYARRNDPTHPLGPAQFSQVIFPLTHQLQGAKKCDALGWYGEETLDVEAVHAMAPGAHILYVGGSDCLDVSLDKALNAVVANGWAQIVTNSYGDLGEDIPADEVDAFESIVIEAAAQGIGVYFSSGDDGDEVSTLGHPAADFPASSPWVTAVGGTSLGVGADGGTVIETGWETGRSALVGADYVPAAPGAFQYGSGGGTSVLFAEPDYQIGVVPDALAHAQGPVAGRVVPDIAVDGDPSTGMLVGQTQKFPDGVYYDQYRIGGTSLSSPVFAGIMALADDLAGAPHGFINPTLYSTTRTTAGAITDVVHQNGAVVRVDFNNMVDTKRGTSTTVRTFDLGGLAIETTPGYDNTTGLGTPNGTTFLQHI